MTMFLIIGIGVAVAGLMVYLITRPAKAAPKASTSTTNSLLSGAGTVIGSAISGFFSGGGAKVTTSSQPTNGTAGNAGGLDFSGDTLDTTGFNINDPANFA